MQTLNVAVTKDESYARLWKTRNMVQWVQPLQRMA